MEIKDSGVRTTYESGAVRDTKEGMGRRDLMPLCVISRLFNKKDGECVLYWIEKFKKNGNVVYLYTAIQQFIKEFGTNGDTSDYAHAFLEVSIQFEMGAKKYGENNWQKGIPVNSYIHSAVGHYLKYKCDWEDEPHYRAVLWNLLCAIWTCENKPELNVYATVDNGSDDIPHATNVLYAENKPTMCYNNGIDNTKVSGDSGKIDTKNFIKDYVPAKVGDTVEVINCHMRRYGELFKVLEIGESHCVKIDDGLWLNKDEYEVVIPDTENEGGK